MYFTGIEKIDRKFYEKHREDISKWGGSKRGIGDKSYWELFRERHGYCMREELDIKYGGLHLLRDYVKKREKVLFCEGLGWLGGDPIYTETADSRFVCLSRLDKVYSIRYKHTYKMLMFLEELIQEKEILNSKEVRAWYLRKRQFEKALGIKKNDNNIGLFNKKPENLLKFCHYMPKEYKIEIKKEDENDRVFAWGSTNPHLDQLRMYTRGALG